MYFGNRYALMEMGLDLPDMPVGMVTDLHVKRCNLHHLAFFNIYLEHLDICRLLVHLYQA